MSQVMLAFRRCFWPPELFDVVCTDSFIPEFWCTRYPASAAPQQQQQQQQQQQGSLPHSPSAAPTLDTFHQAAASASTPSGPLFSAEPDLPTALQQPARLRASQPAAEQTSPGSLEYPDSSGLHGLVGFTCGRKADAASELSRSDILAKALQQLDAMYGERPCHVHCSHAPGDLTPAFH